MTVSKNDQRNHWQYYCEYFCVDQTQVAQHPQLRERMLRQSDELEALIAGYSEMSRLNQAICTEFASCDCEGFHINQETEG